MIRTTPIYLEGDTPPIENMVWVALINVNGYMAAGIMGDFIDITIKNK
jgi:hypothetical protein